MTMQIQGTNDSSIVSKLSSSKQGYFEDNFLKLFVAREQRRSPIINRGYYIRFKAIEAVFKSWFSIVSSELIRKFQVVSLGAGFDSSYFRLKSNNQLPDGGRYIEIDYPEVMHRKLECINKFNLIHSNICTSKNSKIVFSSEEYVMIGHDLRNYEDLRNIFKELEISLSCPTLFLSECAVTYMPVESSNGLIQWIQRNFPNSTFVTYEQVHPNDGFGIIMQNHFTSLQCPLKSISNYPDEDKQCSRYKDLGWKECISTTMFDFFMTLPAEEKSRIQGLELFDEYEMWHEKCHHYILIWACQGANMILPGPEVFSKKSSVVNSLKDIDRRMTWQLEEADALLHRFGHQIFLLTPHLLLLSGGFGPVEKKHQRLGGLTLVNLLNKTCSNASIMDHEEFLGKRMFHTSTKLSTGHVIITGGRSSPNKMYAEVVLIKYMHENNLDEQNDMVPNQDVFSENATFIKESFSLELKAVLPVPVWRHSASLVEVGGVESLVIFGGCTVLKKETVECSALNECYILNTETWTWTKVCCQEHTPSLCHSHSAVTYEKKKVIVTGGLSINETILNSAHVFDSERAEWSTLVISGLLPRYSHTSHVWKDNVILVGGITSSSGFSLGVGIVCLTTLTAIECSAPAQDPEYPILLSNHCSYLDENCIIIIGGGGNCFSFGTHFNKRIVRININKLPLITL